MQLPIITFKESGIRFFLRWWNGSRFVQANFPADYLYNVLTHLAAALRELAANLTEL